jgi:hypothetical protein
MEAKSMKKKVPSYVPQGPIRWLMGRVHVGTPDVEIEADIRRRMVKNNPTEEQMRACVDYALACHRENQGLYHTVMTGKF